MRLEHSLEMSKLREHEEERVHSTLTESRAEKTVAIERAQADARREASSSRDAFWKPKVAEKEATLAEMRRRADAAEAERARTEEEHGREIARLSAEVEALMRREKEFRENEKLLRVQMAEVGTEHAEALAAIETAAESSRRLMAEDAENRVRREGGSAQKRCRETGRSAGKGQE